ncbi:hypothetical protein FGO68_gene4657 [Halteria grandinella]|uniref:Uncharacterized protein n=1 Tax=Halteria grandinella TaxID=5974 RepID=A0A8J8P4V5_HALGN|nr:hypothetical protein FGO68_gene4657 [Halteria grandinella]
MIVQRLGYFVLSPQANLRPLNMSSNQSSACGSFLRPVILMVYQSLGNLVSFSISTHLPVFMFSLVTSSLCPNLHVTQPSSPAILQVWQVLEQAVQQADQIAQPVLLSEIPSSPTSKTFGQLPSSHRETHSLTFLLEMTPLMLYNRVLFQAQKSGLHSLQNTKSPLIAQVSQPKMRQQSIVMKSFMQTVSSTIVSVIQATLKSGQLFY